MYIHWFYDAEAYCYLSTKRHSQSSPASNNGMSQLIDTGYPFDPWMLLIAESISISIYSFGVRSVPCWDAYLLHKSWRFLYLTSSKVIPISCLLLSVFVLSSIYRIIPLMIYIDLHGMMVCDHDSNVLKWNGRTVKTRLVEWLLWTLEYIKWSYDLICALWC